MNDLIYEVLDIDLDHTENDYFEYVFTVQCGRSLTRTNLDKDNLENLRDNCSIILKLINNLEGHC